MSHPPAKYGRPFVDAAKNAEEACRNRQNEDIRIELSRVLKNIADSNGQLAEAGKSLSALAENLNEVADSPVPDGSTVVAFVRKLLGEVQIPGEHNSIDSDSLRLLEFSHLFEHARVLSEKDEPPTQNVLSTEASDEDVLLWLGVLDKEVSSRNELISEYVDFIASVFRSLQEEGAWDKRTSLGNEKRLLEVASTYEARRRALKERERIEQERVEREERERIEAERRQKEAAERQRKEAERPRKETEGIRRDESKRIHREETERIRQEADGQKHEMPEATEPAYEQKPKTKVRKANKSQPSGHRATASTKIVEQKSLTTSVKAESESSENSSLHALLMALPLWIPILIILAVVVFAVWMGISVVGWAFRHWIITSAAVGAILLMICFRQIVRRVGDRVKSSDDTDDLSEDDVPEEGDEADDV